MKVVAFLFSVVIFCCFIGKTEAQECGIGSASEIFAHDFVDQFRVNNKIIGGKAFKDGAFPWVVYLSIAHDDDPGAGCTGTVISPNYILTAKHCTTFQSLYSITIYYGSANRQRMISQVSTVTFQSQGFDVVGQDIALIKLETPIQFNENVSSICLSRSMRPQLGEKAIVAGFGLVFGQLFGVILGHMHVNRTQKEPVRPKAGDEVNETNMNVNTPNDLNAVKVDIVEDVKCTCNCSIPKDVAMGIQNGTELCAGGLLAGTLEGDSGGPLMVLDKNSMQWFQVGGQTYATNDSTKIVDYGVYTDVSKFCDWIESTTNTEVTCDP